MRRGAVVVPSSKSIAHRELIAAALSGGEPPIVRGESNDTRATRNCLKAMMTGESVWPCGESGTTLRLLEPIAGVMGWKGEFACEGRLGERPRMPFVRQTRYVIPGNVSSQFVSGLLMALPLADWDSEIVIDGHLQSEAYVRLTEDVLRESGIEVEKSSNRLKEGEGAIERSEIAEGLRLRRTKEGKIPLLASALSPSNFSNLQPSQPSQRWTIRGGQRYRFVGGREVEGDWSQAAFFLAMGAEVKGLRADSHQGDRAVVELLSRIDAEPADPIDISQTPDLYPVLAAVAAARGKTVSFCGTERLRLKESDRLHSTAALIEAVKHGSPVDTFGDHRIAMSAAVMACFATRPIEVVGAECVAKSYPGFWDDFESLERIAP